MKISVCGKGGSGKSTVVALLTSAAQEKGYSVLVVDSDESNSGLFRTLGLEAPPVPLMELLGGKASVKKKMGAAGLFDRSEITVKDIQYPHMERRDGRMLVSIGKILQSLEGCACPMGVLSREFLKKLRLGEKEIALVDMEAGVEHFGRGIDEGIDEVLLVVEPSFESIIIAEKIKGLAAGMKKEAVAVLNKAPSEKVAQRLEGELKNRGIKVIGTIPNDPDVFDASLEGRYLERGEALHAAGDIFDKLLAETGRVLGRE
jgi:CO dehydrogenase maturation factor